MLEGQPGLGKERRRRERSLYFNAHTRLGLSRRSSCYSSYCCMASLCCVCERASDSTAIILPWQQSSLTGVGVFECRATGGKLGGWLACSKGTIWREGVLICSLEPAG